MSKNHPNDTWVFKVDSTTDEMTDVEVHDTMETLKEFIRKNTDMRHLNPNSVRVVHCVED